MKNLMKPVLATLAMTAALAAPAMAGSLTYPAADPVVPAPAITYAAAVSDWSGAYGGVQLGYGMATASGGLDGNGAVGGLTLGYDRDFGSFVMGAAIDYDLADIDLGGGVNVDNITRLKLRAGYDMGQSLVYATAGAARADVATLGTDNGWLLGFGYERRLTETLSLGTELVYHKFDDFNDTGIDVEATTVQVKAIFRF